ncbi:hypothetical protein UFOVP342_39 [uncultured Caudovirales phage]|uniref:Uncharacterized protein n=1 Tax=uncultured Caudovirales phage TaxID=2100421 RepID=A0A6J5M269_9CAUD|nr:hypothetical protein UFOVP342_39 [uncultured Caudovirales phage]
MYMQWKYLVVDEDGFGLKKFFSLSDAKYFLELRKDCKLIKLPFKSKTCIYNELADEVGECLF